MSATDTTALDALDRLIAVAVSGSDQWSADDVKAATGRHYQRMFLEATTGSLDAALSLHQALLPGWIFDVTNGSAFVVHPDFVEGEWDDEHQFSAENHDPARALLLATLHAYRASLKG